MFWQNAVLAVRASDQGTRVTSQEKEAQSMEMTWFRIQSPAENGI